MAARIVAHIMARTPNLATCAASCSPSSVRWVQVQPLQPLQPLQLQPRHRRGPSALGRASSASIQSRLSEVQVAVVVGPITPNFRCLRRGRSRPRRPLFLIWHRYLPTYWDFEWPGTSLGGAAEHLGLSSRALPRPAPLDELLHEPSVPVVARGGEGVCRQWQSLGGPPFAVLRSVASAAALGRPLPLGSARVPEVAS